MPFRFTYQLDEDVALASALATKAAHDFFQALGELLCLVTQGLGRRRALVCDRHDES